MQMIGFHTPELPMPLFTRAAIRLAVSSWSAHRAVAWADADVGFIEERTFMSRSKWKSCYTEMEYEPFPGAQLSQVKRLPLSLIHI